MRDVKIIAWFCFLFIGKSLAQVVVSVPDTVVVGENIVTLPVVVDLKTYKIASYEFEIQFDPQVIEIKDVIRDSSLTSCWPQPYVNLNTPGKVIAGGYHLTDAIQGTGALVHLRFNIVGEHGDHSLLSFAYCKFHGDYPPVVMKNGYVWIHYKSDIDSFDKAPRIPVKCTLTPNYPDPFSLTTNIQYTVRQRQNIIIKIFDITGKEIQLLINKQHQPGTYNLNWNARDRLGSALPSGIYLCMLRTEKSISLEKLTLIR